MKRNTKTKWQINKELTEHCKQLLNHNSKVINGYTVIDSILLNKTSGATLNLLEEDKFNLVLPNDEIADKEIIRMAEKLRAHIGLNHADFYKKFDELKASDSQVTLSSKAQKIIYQIAFNMDRIPELKDEIINIGKLLEKEKDIYEHYGF